MSLASTVLFLGLTSGFLYSFVYENKPISNLEDLGRMFIYVLTIALAQGNGNFKNFLIHSSSHRGFYVHVQVTSWWFVRRFLTISKQLDPHRSQRLVLDGGRLRVHLLKHLDVSPDSAHLRETDQFVAGLGRPSGYPAACSSRFRPQPSASGKNIFRINVFCTFNC